MRLWIFIVVTVPHILQKRVNLVWVVSASVHHLGRILPYERVDPLLTLDAGILPDDIEGTRLKFPNKIRSILVSEPIIII